VPSFFSTFATVRAINLFWFAEFVTHGDKVVIIGDGSAGQAANAAINDTNVILDGLTLEILKGGIPATPPTLKVASAQGSIVITYDGKLQASDKGGKSHAWEIISIWWPRRRRPTLKSKPPERKSPFGKPL
jgi:hypothetical protein